MVKDVGPHVAPTGLVQTAGSSSSVSISWSDNSTEEWYYYVQWAPAGTYSWQTGPELPANSTNYTITGLTSAASYKVRVFVTGVNGPLFSDEIVATAQPLPSSSPTPPTGLSATSSSSSTLNLTWTDNASNEHGYRVQWRKVGDTPYQESALLPADTQSYGITGLLPVPYEVRVFAFNQNGNGTGFSEQITATPANPSLQEAINLASSSQTSSSIALTWQDNSSAETGYVVQWALASGGGWTTSASLPVNTQSYTITGLTASTPYRVRVVVNGSGGVSQPSQELSVSTAAELSNPPAGLNQPTNVVAAASSATALTVTWQDNSSNEWNYYVQWAPAGTYNWSSTTDLPADTQSYVINGLLAGSYRVRVFVKGPGSQIIFSDETIGEVSGTASPPPSGAINSVQTIINDMVLANNPATVGFPSNMGWPKHAVVTMGNNPRTSNLPADYLPGGAPLNSAWSSPNYLWTGMQSWFAVTDGVGNAATNTRVQIRNLKKYIKRASDGVWVLLESTASPAAEYYKKDDGGAGAPSGTPSLRDETGNGGGVSFVPPGGNAFIHGWGSSVTFNPADLSAVFITGQARLVVDNPALPDDRSTAVYLMAVAGDYYPTASTMYYEMPKPWFPGIGNSRFKLVSTEWQSFNFATIDGAASDPGGTISQSVFSSNPPPLE